MVAAHKFSRSHADIRTALSPDRVAAISKAVGEITVGDVLIGVNRVRFEGAGPGHIDFSVRALRDVWELMRFRVAVEATAEGSRVRTSIDPSGPGRARCSW